ncbi:hypothetical protein PFISCL1PPCAC_8786, partial [Pristionchus fissidentatus]
IVIAKNVIDDDLTVLFVNALCGISECIQEIAMCSKRSSETKSPGGTYKIHVIQTAVNKIDEMKRIHR